MSTLGDVADGKVQTRARLDFALQVPAFLRVKFFAQPEAITVQEDDLRRGYVDIPANTYLQVLTNIRDGYVVHVKDRVDVVHKIVVRGENRNVEIDAEAGGAVLRQSSQTPESKLALGYRFFLTPGLSPGNYPWPLTLSAATQY